MTSDRDAAPAGRRSAGTEERLVERARRGDGEALASLVERHREALEHFAASRLPARLRRRVSVADLLQDANVVALQRCREFEPRGPDSFRNWLMGIVDRKVREAVRSHEGAEKRSVRNEVTRTARRETGQFAGRTPSPSQVAVAAELAELAEEAFQRVPYDQREMLRLTRQENLSLDEAAARLGRSPEAARKLLSRALVRFAQEFERLKGRGGGR